MEGSVYTFAPMVTVTLPGTTDDPAGIDGLENEVVRVICPEPLRVAEDAPGGALKEGMVEEK
jgi:hypothetical protein